MLHKQINKIYSTNVSSDQSSLIEIETIILNGLYRFSILGINQKNSSDIKDRVYSALRSQKLMNLKSDNKKITVNLLPTNIDKKSNTYDLGIALSCLIHMNQIEIYENILAVGELSITGNIIPSCYILKSIYQAIQNNINIIICSYSDLEILNNYQNNINDLIEKHHLRFIAANTLGDLIDNIRENIYFTFRNTGDNMTYIENTGVNGHYNILEKNIFKILLAICTNRNIFIENKKESYINKFLKNLMYYNHRLDNWEMLRISNNLNKTDTQILSKHTYPTISFIDSQTQKEDLQALLSESLFGFNIIEDFISIPEDILHVTKKLNQSSIICFYNPCPCGNSGNLFSSFQDDKCLCLQRNILRYRQKLHRLENKFFDFYIKDLENNVSLNYNSSDYINMNKIITRFRSTCIEVGGREGEGEETLIDKYHDYYEKAELDKIIHLAKDIAKFEYVLGKTKKPILLKDNIDLAVQFIKKGF